ncbi:carboxymuconolactone decarboxylase family protein [Ramlibacter sp. AW1]|uniref:Carboxymuconolactone decarboxylase family protein n=1 Tax=Ramlibacter aurantiacus TaxID=2801330 RepID=A0A936ZS28_9BURK|nr:carboxymuconolactone decarboxylase family protein [Ramlibacter aurantiacus]MBL0422626.1 carboxymuconolactone decarboxylase family protein [Ramlibacter aurantiacus]
MRADAAHETLAGTFGQADWIDTLVSMGPEQAKGFAQLVNGILNEGPLPVKIKHFMLFIIFVAKGYEPLARAHADAANRAGATVEEWHEVLAVFLPSRGTMMYMEGARVLGLDKALTEGADDSDTAFKRKDEILAYFKKAMGELPGFVRILADKKPTLFEGYFKLRSENLKDAFIPQKYKELMLVALNTAERYQTGLEIHAKAALGCGASQEEVLDGMTTAILGGGVPGWIEAAQVYERICPGQATAKAE